MKYKILHVVSDMGRGGLETLVLNLNQLMVDSDYTFDYVVHGNEIGHYEKELQELGVNIHFFPNYKPLKSLSYIMYWKQFLKEHPDYKIIHCHIRSYASLIYFAARKFPIEFIIHSHSTSNGKGLKNNLKNFLQLPFKRSLHHVYRLACSEDAGKWLFGNKKFDVLKNGIILNDFTFSSSIRNKLREEYNLNGKNIIGHIGGFREVKNHSFLLEVFKSYCEIDENAHLILLGCGSLIDKILQKSKQMGIYEKVSFLGNVGNVNEIINMFDIFLFPSLHEGLGLVLVEAQANGLECVASDQVPKESDLTGHVSYLKLNDPIIWRDEIITKINFPRYNAIDLIIKNGFDLHESAKQLEELYCRIICE